MLRSLLKKLPKRFVSEIKRLHYSVLIKRNKFVTLEPEYQRLGDWISDGDCVIDIGANVGHYSLKLSELVGPKGRVIAFEPVPETFAQLANNSSQFPYENITLMNCGVSEKSNELGMTVPSDDAGDSNFYEAYLTEAGDGLSVMCFSIDSIDIPHKVSLVKIDAEGHEALVLKGMVKLLERDHPVLIIEGVEQTIADFLNGYGYEYSYIEGSPNRVFHAASE